MTAISVIIPAYERPELVQCAVQSVLDQSFGDLEVIVVDDGSPRGLLGQCAALRHRKVRCIRQERQGAGAARNRGMTEAQGDFVAFLDSDDVMLPANLSSLRAQFDRNPCIAVVHGWAIHCDQSRREVQLVRPKLRGRSYPQLLFRNTLSMGTVLVRRGCWEPIVGFNTQLPIFEDWDFWLRLSFYCDFDFVPKAVARISVQDVRRNTSLPSSRVGETVRAIYANLLQDPISRSLVGHRKRQLAANGHVMTGHHYRMYDQDLRAAQREFLRAIRIAPSLPAAYIGLVESMVGQSVTDKLRVARSVLYRWHSG